MTSTINDNQPATTSSQPASAEPIAAQSVFERWRRKIFAYADQALENGNAREGNLELVAGNLMHMILWLREDVERCRTALTDPLERLRLTSAVSEQTYKLSKQLHAYADLVMRLQSARRQVQPRGRKTLLRLKKRTAK